MILKLLKKNRILLFIIFLLVFVSVIFFTNKLDKAETVKKKVKVETKTLEPKVITRTVIEVKREEELEKEEVKEEVKEKSKIENEIRQKNLAEHYLLKTPHSEDKIDFIGESNSIDYEKSTLEIEHIMKEPKKITAYGPTKYAIEKEEDWKVDYGVGLEDGAVENLKNNRTLKSDMLNVKVGLSTSF